MKHLFKKGIRQQIILPMIITTICAVLIIYSFLIYKNEKNIVDASFLFAKSNIEQYLTLRKYYTNKIVDTVQNYSQLEIDTSLTNKKNTIPLPATMIHDLSQLLKESKSHIQIKLYSNYPFPHRKNRVLDKFEKESLEFLEKDPKKTFFRREIYENKDSVRLAVSDTMSSLSCVSCHNTLSSSPKTNWKLNEVRGALEIIVPINNVIEINAKNSKQLTFLVLLILFLSIFIIYLFINTKIIKNIEKISDFVKNITRGNLDNKLVIPHDNELKSLNENINLMRISLKETLTMLNEENNTRKKAEKDLIYLNSNLEEKIKQRTKEIQSTNETLITTLEELKNTQNNLIESKKMAELGELVGSVTHEINTPLGTSITTSSYIESLSKDIKKLYSNEEMTEEDFENYLNTINESVSIILNSLNRVSSMINSFKHIAVDQTIEDKRVFYVKKYIEEILLTLRNKTKKFKHTILLDIDENLAIDSYPGYFYQILTNFINNSYLHGFEGIKSGNILIKVTEDENNIKLIYSDDGIGLDSNAKDKLFQEYYTSKKNKGGTGLGLAIVKKIVIEKLKGTIVFESERGKGLTYTITFPKK